MQTRVVLITLAIVHVYRGVGLGSIQGNHVKREAPACAVEMIVPIMIIDRPFQKMYYKVLNKNKIPLLIMIKLKTMLIKQLNTNNLITLFLGSASLLPYFTAFYCSFHPILYFCPLLSSLRPTLLHCAPVFYFPTLLILTGEVS